MDQQLGLHKPPALCICGHQGDCLRAGAAGGWTSQAQAGSPGLIVIAGGSWKPVTWIWLEWTHIASSLAYFLKQDQRATQIPKVVKSDWPLMGGAVESHEEACELRKGGDSWPILQSTTWAEHLTLLRTSLDSQNSARGQGGIPILEGRKLQPRHIIRS